MRVDIVKKYYYIYKTTNILNNKFYVGMHSTNDMDDGYLGSGKILKNSIKKYGRHNFSIQILEHCNSKSDLINREKAIITKELIDNPLCMNINLGGGSSWVMTAPWDTERKERYSVMMTGQGNPRYGKERTAKERAKISKNHADVSGTNNPMSGKTHTDNVKVKLKLLQAAKNREPHVCIHCDRTILGAANYTRFHGDKCKSKTQSTP